MSSNWLYSTPTTELSPYNVLEVMSMLDTAFPVGKFAFERPDYQSTVGNLAYFYVINRQSSSNNLLHFMDHVSSMSLHLLGPGRSRALHSVSDRVLKPAERSYIADTLRFSMLLHQHNGRDVTWLQGRFMELLLHLVAGSQERSSKKHHALANTMRVTFTYFVELLLDGHEGVYEAFSQHFATLCTSVLSAAPDLQAYVLAAIQGVLYADTPSAFNAHHKLVVHLLGSVTTAQSHQHAAVLASLKNSLTAKLLGQYNKRQIRQWVAARTKDLERLNTASSSGSASICSVSDGSQSSSSCLSSPDKTAQGQPELDPFREAANDAGTRDAALVLCEQKPVAKFSFWHLESWGLGSPRAGAERGPFSAPSVGSTSVHSMASDASSDTTEETYPLDFLFRTDAESVGDKGKLYYWNELPSATEQAAGLRVGSELGGSVRQAEMDLARALQEVDLCDKADPALDTTNLSAGFGSYSSGIEMLGCSLR